jgi:ribosomal RNA-processing protein 12
VRKRSQDGIKRLLSRPPSPSIHHPATIPTLDFCIQHLSEYSNASTQDAKKESESRVLHILVFLKGLLPIVGIQATHDKTRAKLGNLIDALLALPVKSSGSGNTVMTQWIFQVRIFFITST